MTYGRATCKACGAEAVATIERSPDGREYITIVCDTCFYEVRGFASSAAQTHSLRFS